MRHFIIGLSVILFALSGIITLKAFEIPANKIRHQNSQQSSVEPEKPFIIAAENLENSTNEQKSDSAVIIEESQTNTPSVDDKLPTRSGESKLPTPSAENKFPNKNKVIK